MEHICVESRTIGLIVNETGFMWHEKLCRQSDKSVLQILKFYNLILGLDFVHENSVGSSNKYWRDTSSFYMECFYSGYCTIDAFMSLILQWILLDW